MRGADCLAAAMKAAGVEVVFSLSGNQIMTVYDALIEPAIRIVHTRHEAAAVFMADAYGQLTGKVGVALVTAAPGFGNALGALYTAAMQEAPVVFLSGDAPVARDGHAPFQEFPQVAAARPFVKESWRVRKPEDLAVTFAEAVRMALSGRKGPVHIALPHDVLTGDAPAPELSETLFKGTIQTPAQSDVDEIARRLRQAKKPLILTGPSMTRTRVPDFANAAEKAFGAPVVDLESPRGLRDPSIGAFAEILSEADALLYLGKPVDFTTGFGEAPHVTAPIVMVVDPETGPIERARALLGDRLVVTMRADPVEAGRALVSANPAGGDRNAWQESVRAAVNFRAAPDVDGLSAVDVAGVLQSTVDRSPEPIFICDGGEFGQWVQAHVKAPTRLINGTSGVIGNCLPYAIAAKIARPEATVVAAMGDGTAGFHIAEFETAVREDTPVTIVIGNDSRWNAEYMLQVRSFGEDRTIGCELSPDARYDLAAIALGCLGTSVRDRGELSIALDDAVAADRATCLDVRITPVQAPQFSRKPGVSPY